MNKPKMQPLVILAQERENHAQWIPFDVSDLVSIPDAVL